MIQKLLDQLEKVQPKGSNRYMACCPAHEDSDPSLALTELQDGRILIHCFAGCSPIEILNTVGLSMGDLFPEGWGGEFKGWDQLKREQESRRQAKQNDSLTEEKYILEICNTMRKGGERLTPKDLQREQQAFIRVRDATAQ